MMSLGRSGASILIALLAVRGAQCGVIINVTEVGGNVIFAGTGSVDLNGLEFRTTLPNQRAGFDLGEDPPVFWTADGEYSYYHGGGGVPHGIVGPLPFGVFPFGIEFADSFSGDMLSMNTGGTNNIVHPIIGVAADYESGDPLSLQMAFVDETIASLQITPGTYVWSWGSGDIADSLTVNVVPEPSTINACIGLGLSGLVYFIRRRRRGHASLVLVRSQGD